MRKGALLFSIVRIPTLSISKNCPRLIGNSIETSACITEVFATKHFLRKAYKGMGWVG